MLNRSDARATYGAAAQITKNPREAEAQLFSMAANRLLRAETFAQRLDALEFNRKLWQTIAIDLSLPENRLPGALRAQILSIAGVVLRLCDAGRSDPGVIETLVELNRTFSGGMAGRAERQDAA
jgi:flagellar biosynthesis activator protein FlaF